MIDRLNLPQETHEYVKDSMPLRQPIEELERLATEKSITFRSGALSYAETVWNSQLGPYQQVMNLRYTLSSSAFAGVIGQVRTKLVDIAADLTAGTPLTELPATARVDAVMRERVGHVSDAYNEHAYPRGLTSNCIGCLHRINRPSSRLCRGPGPRGHPRQLRHPPFGAARWGRPAVAGLPVTFTSSPA